MDGDEKKLKDDPEISGGADIRYCPNCGRPGATQNYCPYCGYELNNRPKVISRDDDYDNQQGNYQNNRNNNGRPIYLKNSIHSDGCNSDIYGY